MKRLLLIRHGLTAGNREGRYIGGTDEPLCPGGASALPRGRLDGVSFLILSPMIRALQTACILCGCAPAETALPRAGDEILRLLKRDGRTVLVCPGLREIDFGKFEGKNWRELTDDPAYQAWIDSGGTLPFPGGESRAAFEARTLEAFTRAAEAFLCSDAEEGALIAHGGTLMSILGAAAYDPCGGRTSYFDYQVPCGSGFVIRPGENGRGRRRWVVEGEYR